jgi:uncharacterized damage-inducible protein DinB
MKSQLVEAWLMSNDANLFLLDNIPAAGFKESYAPRTRTVASQFAHMHNTRLRWLKHAASELAGDVEAFPRGAQPTAKGKVRSWIGSPPTFLSYMVAHEAQHRGLVMVALRLSGHKPPQEVMYGQWQWGKMRNLRSKKK